MTPAEYARHRGCSRVAVWKHIKDGKLLAALNRTDEGYTIDPAIADRLWAQTVDPTRGKPLGGNTGGRPGRRSARVGAPCRVHPTVAETGASTLVALNASRARKAEIDAESAAMDLAARNGELVSRDEVNRWIRGMVAHAKEVILRLPAELRGRVQTDPASAEQIMQEHAERALNELADYRG